MCLILSKCNAIEHCRGISEQHWNGILLDSVDVVIQYTGTMTWKRNHPVVELVTMTSSCLVLVEKDPARGQVLPKS